MVKTITVSEETHKKLEDYKIHDRERFEDVIKRAMKGELDHER